MTRNIKVAIEVVKTISVVIRKRDRDNQPWDWYVDGDVDHESTEYFDTIEQAIDDAEKVLGA